MSQVVHNTPTPQMLTTLMVTPAANVPPPLTPILQNCNGGIHEENLKHTTKFQTEFKTEPALDIIETNIGGTPQSAGNCFALQDNNCPKIRLTPTSKLLASPNPIDPKRKFICPYENCTKSYGKSSHLRSHLTWHTGVKPFVCSEPMCGKGFTRSDELNRHVRTHTGEKPFECVQCTKKFSRSDHLTKHLATHERQMKTPIKHQPSPKVTPRRAAKLSKNRTDSQPCLQLEEGIHFMAVMDERPSEQLQLPLGTVHPTEAMQVGNQQMESATQFSVKDKHAEHAGEFQVMPTTQPLPLPLEATQHSDNFAFNSSTPLVKNEPIDDVDGLLPELPPPDGPNTYGMPQFIQNTPTKISATQDRPYHCRECMKRFKRQDDLNRHIRTHTGEKPYACDQCKSRFMRSDHLRKHQQTHLKKSVVSQ